MPLPDFRADGWLPSGHHPATWDEIISTFGGAEGRRRASLTRRLLALRDALRARGIVGSLLLNGSYISSKPEPGDFDTLLIGPADIQIRKDADPELAALLDAQDAEAQGYSLFFLPADSPALALLSTLWDISKEGILKGVIEVNL